MLQWDQFKNSLDKKAIAVFGLGKSGLSVTKVLIENGIRTVAWDDNKENIARAKSMGAETQDLSKMDLSQFDYLILSPGIPYTFEPHVVVENASKHQLKIIGDVELLHLLNHNIPTIGITGTNGKSTTTALLAHILKEAGKNIIVAGNIGVPVFDVHYTDDIDYLVLELSSYQLDLSPTFKPDYSVILNISADHLDRHGSMEAYVASKASILSGGGMGVICVDDDFTQVLFDKGFMEGQRKLTPVSVRHAIPEGYYVNNDRLMVNHLGEDSEIFSLDKFPTLKGKHNQQNIACASIVSLNLNIQPDVIFRACESFSGLPHRQYFVGTKNQVTFINDSKATNMEAASKALSAYDNIFWISGGQAKEDGIQGVEVFKDKIVKAYLIGEAQNEFALFLKYLGIAFELCGDLKTAMKKSYAEAEDFGQDNVLLLSPACASWDQFTSFEDRGNQFTSLAKEIINEGSVAE